MSHAQVCPVCKGKGESPFYEGQKRPPPCSGCDGKGWIVVSDEPVPVITVGSKTMPTNTIP